MRIPTVDELKDALEREMATWRKQEDCNVRKLAIIVRNMFLKSIGRKK